MLYELKMHLNFYQSPIKQLLGIIFICFFVQVQQQSTLWSVITKATTAKREEMRDEMLSSTLRILCKNLNLIFYNLHVNIITTTHCNIQLVEDHKIYPRIIPVQYHHKNNHSVNSTCTITKTAVANDAHQRFCSISFQNCAACRAVKLLITGFLVCTYMMTLQTS